MAIAGTRSRRRVLWVVAGVGTAAAGYAAYSYWLKDHVNSRWIFLSESASCAWRMLESLGAISDLSSTVASDLKAFLESDSDEVPRSVRQMLKVTRSPEFQQAVLSGTQSLTSGVVRGLSVYGGHGRPPQGSKGFIEVILEKLFTEEGKGFASAVCSRVVRSLVSSLRAPIPGGGSQTSSSQGSPTAAQQASPSSPPEGQPWMAVLVDLLGTERGKELVAVIVQSFAVNCVGTFLEKAADINMYHDMLTAASRNPELVKELGSHMMAVTIKEAVQAWRFRQPSAPSEPGSGSSSSTFTSSPRAGALSISALSEPCSDGPLQDCETTQASAPKEIAQYLAQPAIRGFILDATGVMTSRGMEAFLLVMFSKIFGSRSQPSPCQLSDESCDALSRPSPQPTQLLWAQQRFASRALAAASVCLAAMLHYLSL